MTASLAVVFACGGFYSAIKDTAQVALAAELVPPRDHGMAFGTLAAVGGFGELTSSVLVGVLWTAFGTGVAFAYSLTLFTAGALLVPRNERS